MDGILQQILVRLGAIEAKIDAGGGVAAPVGGGDDDGGVPRHIVAYDEYMTAHVEPFLELATGLGGPVAEAVGPFREAFLAQRAFLVMASKCQKPTAKQRGDKCKFAGEAMATIVALGDRTDMQTHTKAMSCIMETFAWLRMDPVVVDDLDGFAGGVTYYANTLPRDVAPFRMALDNVSKKLVAYVKENCRMGVPFNPRGMPMADYVEGASDAPPAAAAAPAAAPAAPAAAAPAPAAPAEAKGGGGGIAAALSGGGADTSRLKKVTRDQQTWRAEYKGGDAPAPAAKKAAAPRPQAKPQVKGPPVCEFQQRGAKWNVENQTADQGVVEIAITDLKHTVYIYGCFGATINITGKCKTVVVDSCKRTKVLFDDCVSACEVVNSQRIQIQSRVFVPTVAVDKTDGILIYLPANYHETTIVASKSSEMNVSFPDSNGDLQEKPIPEQFVSRLVLGDDGAVSVHSAVSELYS